MRIFTTMLGLLIGLGGVTVITLSQADTKVVNGVPQRVVAGVTRTRVHDTPLSKRLVWVGVPAALVGAGIGYLATGGASLGAAFLGALLLSAGSASWREGWPKRYGRAGENAQVSDTFLHGLVGGLFGAAAAAYLRKREESWPSRLQPAETGEAGDESAEPPENLTIQRDDRPKSFWPQGPSRS